MGETEALAGAYLVERDQQVIVPQEVRKAHTPPKLDKRYVSRRARSYSPNITSKVDRSNHSHSPFRVKPLPSFHPRSLSPAVHQAHTQKITRPIPFVLHTNGRAAEMRSVGRSVSVRSKSSRTTSSRSTKSEISRTTPLKAPLKGSREKVKQKPRGQSDVSTYTTFLKKQLSQQEEKGVSCKKDSLKVRSTVAGNSPYLGKLDQLNETMAKLQAFENSQAKESKIVIHATEESSVKKVVVTTSNESDSFSMFAVDTVSPSSSIYSTFASTKLEFEEDDPLKKSYDETPFAKKSDDKFPFVNKSDDETPLVESNESSHVSLNHHRTKGDDCDASPVTNLFREDYYKPPEGSNLYTEGNDLFVQTKEETIHDNSNDNFEGHSQEVFEFEVIGWSPQEILDAETPKQVNTLSCRQKAETSVIHLNNIASHNPRDMDSLFNASTDSTFDNDLDASSDLSKELPVIQEKNGSNLSEEHDEEVSFVNNEVEEISGNERNTCDLMKSAKNDHTLKLTEHTRKGKNNHIPPTINMSDVNNKERSAVGATSEKQKLIFRFCCTPT